MKPLSIALIFCATLCACFKSIHLLGPISATIACLAIAFFGCLAMDEINQTED